MNRWTWLFLELGGSEVKRVSPAYHKEIQMDSTENCLGALFYTQTGREAKPMRNMCNRLKGLGRPEEPGWCVHFLLRVKYSSSGRTSLLTSSPCLAHSQQWTVSLQIQAVLWLLWINLSIDKAEETPVPATRNKDLKLSPCKSWLSQDRTNKIAPIFCFTLNLKKEQLLFNSCFVNKRQSKWLPTSVTGRQTCTKKDSEDADTARTTSFARGLHPHCALFSLGISKPLLQE